jgi:hypothetical protein
MIDPLKEALYEIEELKIKHEYRTCRYKGVLHLTRSDLEMIEMYIKIYRNVGSVTGFGNLCRPSGAIAQVLEKIGINVIPESQL